MATVSFDLGMVTSRTGRLLASAFRTHVMFARNNKVLIVGNLKNYPIDIFIMSKLYNHCSIFTY